MLLIADSGSTKTDWCLVNNQGVELLRTQTQGLNPVFLDDGEITQTVSLGVRQLIEQRAMPMPERLTFYGAGVRPEMEQRMEHCLSEVFPQADIQTHNDLLGAARALCGRNEGIAAILGTGSNSCLYDGERIVANTPPMGFILGDEGSGAVMGKRFLGALFKGLLPTALKEEYLAETGQEIGDVIEKVYRMPAPNRFLACHTRFIHAHLHCEQLRLMVVEHFREFFRNNITQYQRPDLPVNCIGSVAFYFREQLLKAAQEEHFTIAHIEQSPMEGLVRYACGE